MKTYKVLCKTCDGKGLIDGVFDTHSSTLTLTICPVCKGTKTQTVHETGPVLTQNKEILIT